MQEDYVKASNTGRGDYFGAEVSLSADGTRLAVAAWSEGVASLLHLVRVASSGLVKIGRVGHHGWRCDVPRSWS